MIDEDPQAYTVRLEALRRSRWVLVDTGTELRRGESADGVAESVADRQEWVTSGWFRVRVWDGADTDTNRRPDGEVVREIPEFTRGMRLFLMAVIVIVFNAVILVPLAITLGAIAAAKSQWVESATVGQAIQWSVWIIALSGSLDMAYILVRERRWFAAFVVHALSLEQLDLVARTPRRLAENVLVETVTAALAVTVVLATQMQESERVAALAVACTAVHVLAWNCFRRGPSIIRWLRRPRSEGG